MAIPSSPSFPLPFHSDDTDRRIVAGLTGRLPLQASRRRPTLATCHRRARAGETSDQYVHPAVCYLSVLRTS